MKVRKTLKPMIVSWWSGGVSSALATFYAKKWYKNIDFRILFEDNGQHHPDTYRFKDNCESLYGQEIITIKSKIYADHYDVFKQAKAFKIQTGNFTYRPCTKYLKRIPRQEFEFEHPEIIAYVWGFDKNEAHRLDRLNDTPIGVKNIAPLIIKEKSKEEAHGLLEYKLGIKRPEQYNLGFPNNNCIGCIEAGMGDWNKVRKHFPEVFKKFSNLEQEIGHSILKQCYLKDLDPNRGNEGYIMPKCGLFCNL